MTSANQTYAERLDQLFKAGLSVIFYHASYDPGWAASISSEPNGSGVFNVGGSTPSEALANAQDCYEMNWPIADNEV